MNEDSVRIKILCVDDHPIVRQGIAGLLTAEPDMVLVAEAAIGRHRAVATLLALAVSAADTDP